MPLAARLLLLVAGTVLLASLIGYAVSQLPTDRIPGHSDGPNPPEYLEVA